MSQKGDQHDEKSFEICQIGNIAYFFVLSLTACPIAGIVKNDVPAANGGPDQNVTTGSVVVLDGSESSDADGDNLTYNWSFASEPDGSSAMLSDSTVVNPTFTADVDGTYVISLVVNDGTVDSEPDTVTVTALTIISIDVSPTNRTIPLGFTKQFFATATLADNSTKDISTIVTWTSSNDGIATINSNGLATSVSEGVVTIEATLFELSGSTSLTITPVEIVSLSIDNGFSITISDGQTLQLTATGTFSDGSSRDVTEEATWSVPFFDADVLSVSDTPGTKGFVTTNAVGVAQVYAEIGGIDEVIFITVEQGVYNCLTRQMQLITYSGG